MQIFVDDIPEEGMTLQLESEKTLWLKTEVDRIFPDKDSHALLKVAVTLIRIDDNVSITGDIKCEYDASCDRCLKEYRCKFSFPLNLLMLPQEDEKKKSKDEDVSAGETEILFYESNRIYLNEIIGEQTVINVPMKRLCTDDCKGLCSKCGKDLNEGECGCVREEGDPRLSVLRNWRKGNQLDS
ncbi:MAG: DUF177 domain-containing protein [Pseudomonadota bacterium]